MTDTNTLSPCPHLESCPWCGCALYVVWRRANPRASCKTEGCFGRKMAVVNLDDPSDVAAWNRRAPAPAPTDAEILALNAGEVHFSESPSKYPAAGFGTQYHAGAPGVLSFARAVLAKWGTPAPASQPVAVPAGMEPYAQHAAVAAPKKWAPEEVADGGRGIRWVTNEGVHGRPTDHDVREYLERTPTANGCHCDDCKRFYATASDVTAAPAQAGEYPPLVCDYCGALTPDPWHSSGMLHGKMSKHIHSCDVCAARGAAKAAPEDASARFKAQHEFLIWNREQTPPPIESATEYSVFNQAVDFYIAARAAQGGAA